MYIGLHVKYPLLLSDFNATWILLTDLRKIPKYQISWTSVQWEASCSVQTDRQTDRQKGGRKDTQRDMTQLTVFFQNFANASKNRKKMVSHHICRYGNLPISSTFYQYWPPGFERAQILAKVLILCHARFFEFDRHFTVSATHFP